MKRNLLDDCLHSRMCQIIVYTQIPALAPIHHTSTLTRAPNKSPYRPMVVHCPILKTLNCEHIQVSSVDGPSCNSRLYKLGTLHPDLIVCLNDIKNLHSPSLCITYDFFIFFCRGFLFSDIFWCCDCTSPELAF